MAEIEKNRFGNDPGLDLDNPEESGLETEDNSDAFIEVQDENGNTVRLRVIFSVKDKDLGVVFLFVDQGDDTVLALSTTIDSDGNPTQEELEVVGENSPYLEAAERYLEEYNEGSLDESDTPADEDEGRDAY